MWVYEPELKRYFLIQMRSWILEVLSVLQMKTFLLGVLTVHSLMTIYCYFLWHF